MPPGYNPNVPFVQPGEPVTAGVANRPTVAIENNVQYIKSLLDASNSGQALFARGVTVASGVLVGQSVFFNVETNQFELALAAVENDLTSGTLVPSPSAIVIGVVVTKYSSTLADLLLFGRAPLVLSSAVVGTPTPGLYYLSSQTPGFLTLQAPPVSIPVLFYDGTNCYVLPQYTSGALTQHTHYSFELLPLPAGQTSPPSVGERHVITDPDPDLPGWLPADHPIFNGQAPVGAEFGYNLSQAPELSEVWPPIPLEACSVTLDKGDGVGGTNVPLGHAGLVMLTSTGIFWMSSCYGDSPWPTDLNTSDEVSSSSSEDSCPRRLSMSILLSYARAVFGNANNVVTSLNIKPGSPLTLTDCAGNAATTGALTLALSLGFLLSGSTAAGFIVPKAFNPATNTFAAGPVVEGLIAGSNVTLTSTSQQVVGDATVHQGTVTVNAASNALAAEIDVDTVKLVDTRVRDFGGDAPILSFLPGINSSIRGKICVPPVGLPSSPTLSVRFVLLGEVAGTLPTLTASYMRVPRPIRAIQNPSGSPEIIPDSDTALPITTAYSCEDNELVEVQSSAVAVVAGDTFYFTLARSSGDGYAAEVGLLRMGGIIGAA